LGAVGDWNAECKFEARVGLFPGKKLETARTEVEEAVAAAAQAKEIHYTLTWTGFQAEGCLMDPSVRTLSPPRREQMTHLLFLPYYYTLW
jgi:hypothetical protein